MASSLSSTTNPVPTPHSILPVFFLYINIYAQTDGSIESVYIILYKSFFKLKRNQCISFCNFSFYLIRLFRNGSMVVQYNLINGATWTHSSNFKWQKTYLMGWRGCWHPSRHSLYRSLGRRLRLVHRPLQGTSALFFRWVVLCVTEVCSQAWLCWFIGVTVITQFLEDYINLRNMSVKREWFFLWKSIKKTLRKVSVECC